jgi:hypothetical protein
MPATADVRRAAALAALGAWTVAVPYLDAALGLEVDVEQRVEVVDHVVPGAVAAAVGLALALLARRRPLAGTPAAIAGGGVAALAGFWVLATHVPLVADALRAEESVGAALWHASTALPLLVLSVWVALAPSADDGVR